MPPTDPNLTVRDLIENNWDSSNTNSLTPDFHTGKYREDTSDPQIAFEPDGENPVGGGDTGYASIAPDGSGGVQELSGVIAAHIYDNYGRTGAVKDNLYKFKEEVARIVLANQLNNDDLRVIAPGDYQRPVLVERDPVKLRATQPVAYTRDRRP